MTSEEGGPPRNVLNAVLPTKFYTVREEVQPMVNNWSFLRGVAGLMFTLYWVLVIVLTITNYNSNPLTTTSVEVSDALASEGYTCQRIGQVGLYNPDGNQYILLPDSNGCTPGTMSCISYLALTPVSGLSDSGASSVQIDSMSLKLEGVYFATYSECTTYYEDCSNYQGHLTVTLDSNSKISSAQYSDSNGVSMYMGLTGFADMTPSLINTTWVSSYCSTFKKQFVATICDEFFVGNATPPFICSKTEHDALSAYNLASNFADLVSYIAISLIVIGVTVYVIGKQSNRENFIAVSSRFIVPHDFYTTREQVDLRISPKQALKWALLPLVGWFVVFGVLIGYYGAQKTDETQISSTWLGDEGFTCKMATGLIDATIVATSNVQNACGDGCHANITLRGVTGGFQLPKSFFSTYEDCLTYADAYCTSTYISTITAFCGSGPCTCSGQQMGEGATLYGSTSSIDSITDTTTFKNDVCLPIYCTKHGFAKAMCKPFENGELPPYICVRKVPAYGVSDLISMCFGLSQLAYGIIVMVVLKGLQLFGKKCGVDKVGRESEDEEPEEPSKEKKEGFFERFWNDKVPEELFSIKDDMEPLLATNTICAISTVVILISWAIFAVSWASAQGSMVTDLQLTADTSSLMADGYDCVPAKVYKRITAQKSNPEFMPTTSFSSDCTFKDSQGTCDKMNPMFKYPGVFYNSYESCLTHFKSSFKAACDGSNPSAGDAFYMFNTNQPGDGVYYNISADGDQSGYFHLNLETAVLKPLTDFKAYEQAMSDLITPQYCRPFFKLTPYKCTKDEPQYSLIDLLGLSFGNRDFAMTLMLLILTSAFYLTRGKKKTFKKPHTQPDVEIAATATTATEVPANTAASPAPEPVQIVSVDTNTGNTVSSDAPQTDNAAAQIQAQ